jgi:hypothetical protein
MTHARHQRRFGVPGRKDDQRKRRRSAPRARRAAATAWQTADRTLQALSGRCKFRPPDIALLGYDRLAGLYSQAET